ncbi:hypothetical protein [Psychroflexus sp. MES1-P1E]|uniref:hypothetical protein n=1 Tax=Psychroflexus sp. MES1-P1E TaxID=2058320 RepID=UPI000C7D5269|nr:hypothetical protein [Psychroflexus sp. MES1-P1E]PKG42499.1 hypothetical protein CXF67_10285 [Psychroflexus sp. MES1-P1E]
MLFIIFVENAFKHLGNTKDKKNSVCVSIKEINDKLIFICKNSIDPIVLTKKEIEKGKMVLAYKM